MRVNLSLELTDQDRRRVRAAIGRGGVATRKEIRIFAERAIRGAIADTPDPKPARRVPPVDQAPTRLEQLLAMPDETICGLCREPKSEHGRMALTCSPAVGRRKGQRFTPAAAVS